MTVAFIKPEGVQEKFAPFTKPLLKIALIIIGVFRI